MQTDRARSVDVAQTVPSNADPRMQPPFACAVAFGVLLLFVLVIQDLVLSGWAELAAVMVLVAAFAWWVSALAVVLLRNAQLRRRYLADLRKGIGHG